MKLVIGEFSIQTPLEFEILVIVLDNWKYLLQYDCYALQPSYK